MSQLFHMPSLIYESRPSRRGTICSGETKSRKVTGTKSESNWVVSCRLAHLTPCYLVWSAFAFLFVPLGLVACVPLTYLTNCSLLFVNVWVFTALCLSTKCRVSGHVTAQVRFCYIQKVIYCACDSECGTSCSQSRTFLVCHTSVCLVLHSTGKQLMLSHESRTRSQSAAVDLRRGTTRRN